jgi:hypothetical protein
MSAFAGYARIPKGEKPADFGTAGRLARRLGRFQFTLPRDPVVLLCCTPDAILALTVAIGEIRSEAFHPAISIRLCKFPAIILLTAGGALPVVKNRK